jgi:hypothetical protein
VAFSKGRLGGILLPSAFCDSVLAELELLFVQLVSGQSAKSIHETVLARYAVKWRGIKSSQSCFTCFASAPEHYMTCGHAICDSCVQVFGHSEASDPWLFRLHRCKLCLDVIELAIRVRPPTAGHGILCIDGGGIGGIIPSTILELLQDRLDLPIPVQEHFSMAYGVSVGKIDLLPRFNSKLIILQEGW